MKEDDDIKSVMAEEKSRGVRRKRIDSAEREKIKKTKADLARILASGNERDFMKVMREIGLKDASTSRDASGNFMNLFPFLVRDIRGKPGELLLHDG